MARLPALALACAFALALAAPAHAAFPGANGKLGFERVQAIWVVNPDGSGQTRLSPSGLRAVNPSFSPDGSRIAFLENDSGGLWVMNADGTGARQLVATDNFEFGGHRPSFSPDGKRIAAVFRSGVSIFDSASGALVATFPAPGTDAGYSDPAWNPVDPNKIAVVYARETDAPDPDRDIAILSVSDGSQTPLTFDPKVGERSLDWAPDGSKLVFQQLATFENHSLAGIFTVPAAGGGKVRLRGADFAAEPVYSPDGSKIAFHEPTGSGVVVLWTMGADGSNPQPLYSATAPNTDEEPSWQPLRSPAGIQVELSPSAPTAATQLFELTLTLRNTSQAEDLEEIQPGFPHGFGVANDYYPAGERGEIRVVSGPQPAFPATLAAGESSVHTIRLRAVQAGKVGLKAQVSAKGVGSGDAVDDTHYGEVVIAEKQPLQAERTAMVASGLALFLSNANRALREAQARYARELFEMVKSKLSAKARKFYFGSKNKLKVTELERALARWRSDTPEFTALVTPNKQKLYEGGFAYLNEEQFARYQQQELAAFHKQAGKYMGEKWKDAMGELRYWGQVASEEGRGQLAADWALYRELNKQDGDALLSALGRSVTGAGVSYALVEGDLAIRRNFGQIVDGLLKTREGRLENLAKLAQTDTDKFIGQLAKDDAQLHYASFKTLADQLLGDVQDRVQGKLFEGAKGGFAWLVNATKLRNNKEARALARSTSISERSATLGPSFMDALSEDAKSMINLRKMEAIGGMPTDDVEITKGIVAQVNARMKQLKHDVEVEALFRPANPYKVPGAYAKVETVGVKNVAPIDLALGAPPSLLAETAIFKPVDPEKLPGFKNYPEVEQKLLRERAKIRLTEYNEFHGHKKVEDKKMKEMLKAFEKPHTFDEIGKGRTIKMQLSKQEVEGATVLKYDFLQVEGRTLINGKGKPRPIGTDYDGAALIDKNTRQPLKGQVLSAAEFEFKRLGEKAAQEKGYANPFHGFTAHGTDADAADYPFFAHYWLLHLKEADAIREAQRLAANYNRGKAAGQHVTAAKLLAKVGGLFERHLLRVSASEASFGPANVVFRTPIVGP